MKLLLYLRDRDLFILKKIVLLVIFQNILLAINFIKVIIKKTHYEMINDRHLASSLMGIFHCQF